MAQENRDTVSRRNELSPAWWCRRLAPHVVCCFLLLAWGVQPAGAASPGDVVWVDLLTEDAEAAKAFYTGLFGWRIEPSPTGSFVVYHRDRLIAGIAEIEDRLAEEESYWIVGVVVEDLDASVSAARRLGGTIHIDVSRLEGYARYALIEDPQGAELLLLIPERALGGGDGEGMWVWSELWTDDREAASAFYGEVVGYEHAQIELPSGPYDVLKTGGEARAGLVQFESDEIEPAWAPYVGVDSVGDTIERARKLGGEVLLEPTPELAQGRVALLADPTGGAFFIFELAEEER